MALQLFNKSAEVKLIQLTTDLRAQATGWQAIHFHLSDLLEEYKSEYQIKIAVNLIHDLLKNSEGSLFLLIDSSIIVVCRHLEDAIKDKLIFQLRYLFMDDPLAYSDLGQENSQFCTVYDLKKNWQEFFDLCGLRMSAFARKQSLGVQPISEKSARTERVEHKPTPPERTEKHLPSIEKTPSLLSKKLDIPAPLKTNGNDTGELSAANLVTIERNLRTVDLHSVLRRQPVCAVLPDMKVRRVFDELYINIAHLRKTMKLEVDFLSNRWLFKYITHILDERMIEIIQQEPARYLESPISINLNVETLLSSWFAEFDAHIKPANKVSIVIEVPVIDIFADMTAFILANAEVHKLGYRVCLDGLTTASFSSINREKLGLDLIKVQWNADLHSDLKSKENAALIEAVQNSGNNRVILCRCDNRSAIEYGQALGISLFQGRYLDSVLNPTSKLEN